MREVERTFAAGCERREFRLVHYSLQGNHAHLIVEASNQTTLGRGMMTIGARLARAVNRVVGRTGPVLADRYHFRLLRTPREVRNAQVRIDPASSGEWFDGWKPGVIVQPNTPERSAAGVRPPVARARTWLLMTGWRRHGLLHPADVPA